MVRSGVHELAPFSLVPLNDRAKDVLDHDSNAHLVSSFPAPGNSNVLVRGLDIGFHIGSKSPHTLATLGRGDVNIYIPGYGISRLHCSFEIHPVSKAFMLKDWTSNHSTQISGQDVKQFEPGRLPRHIVMQPKVHAEIGLGGISCNIVRFGICWHAHALDLEVQIRNREAHPRFAPTENEETPTMVSQRLTRIHTPGRGVLPIRFKKVIKCGKGAFGVVDKAINIDSGDLIAVKKVNWPDPVNEAKDYIQLKREVETLARISHPNVIEYIAAQGFQEPQLHIVMALKDGSINELIADGLFTTKHNVLVSLFSQMLRALDYIAVHGIIHRDVKPENILYTPLADGGYTFQLTDFGLCNTIANARSRSGTMMYAAPEVLEGNGAKQTPKVDVWSLFVTIAYALNIGGYRTKDLYGDKAIIRAVLDAAKDPVMVMVKDMVLLDPSLRASAAELLLRHFGGDGLTTPRNKVYAGPARTEILPVPTTEVTGETATRQPGVPRYVNRHPDTAKFAAATAGKGDLTLAGVLQSRLRPRAGLATAIDPANGKPRKVLQTHGFLPQWAQPNIQNFFPRYD